MSSHAMNAAGMQVQCRTADSTGMQGADLDTLSFLPEGRTAPRREMKHLYVCCPPRGKCPPKHLIT